MRKILPCLLALACLLSGAAALAAAPGASGAAGGSGVAFLSLESGPRESGMGGAGAAMGGDVYATIYNPALLGTIMAKEVGLSHAEWLQGTRYDDLIYAQPTKYGNLSLRLMRLGYGAIDSFDATGAPLGTSTAGDLLVSGGYSKKLGKTGWIFGETFKLVRETLGPISAKTVLTDMGLFYAPRRQDRLGEWTAGFSLRNLGTPLRFDQDSAPTPVEVIAGVATRRFDETLALAVDLHYSRNQPWRANAGAEYWLTDVVALRTGLEYPQAQGWGSLGVRAGLGFKMGSWNVDYAFAPMGDLGLVHHLGLRITFGGLDQAAYEEGIKLLRSQRYAEAILKFKEVLDVNPKHPTAKRRIRQAYELWRKENPEELK